MSDAYSRRLDDAIQWVTEAFRPVVRKGGRVPYITHLFGVMSICGEYGGDEDQLIAALLHDMVEDIPTVGLADIESRFGTRVARIVDDCTDAYEQPKPPWRERKEAHLAKVRGVADDSRLVICSDKLHNCRTLNEDLRHKGLSTLERFKGKRSGTLWYFRSMVEALRIGWDHRLLEALDREVTELERLAGKLTTPPGTPIDR